MATVAEIAVRLAANIEDFQSNINKAAKQMDTLASSLQKTGSALTKGITAPLVAVGTGMLVLANKAAATADELKTMSLQTGISMTRLQELRYVTSQTNTNFEALSTAAVQLGKRIVSGAEDSKKLKEIIEGLGIQTMTASGSFRSMDDLFPQVISKLAGMQDITLRNALAMELFGRGGAELVPMLNAGQAGIAELTKRAHDLGLVMGESSVNALAAYHDKMEEVKLAFSTAGAQIASAFLPLLTDKLIPLVTGTIIPALQGFAENIRKVTDWFMKLSPETQNAILGIVGGLAILGPAMLTTAAIIKTVKATVQAMSGPVGWIMLAIELLAVAWITNWNHIRERTEFAIEALKAGFSGMVAGLGIMWNALKKLFYSGVLSILDAVAPLTRFLPSEWATALENMRAATQQKLADIEVNLQSLAATAEAAASRYAAAADKLNSVLNASAGGMGKLREAESQMTASMADSAIPTMTNFTKSVKDNAEALEEQAKKLKETASAVADYYASLIREATKAAKAGVISAAGIVSYAGAGVVEKFGKEGLKAAWEDMKKTYYAATPETLKRMFEVTYGVEPPKLAAGGIVTRPTIAMIGERGPEAVIPLNRGGRTVAVVNLTVQAGGVSGDSYSMRRFAQELMPHITSALHAAGVG